MNTPPTDMPRCSWCNTANPLYVTYHDHEWGVPVHDDRKLFEMLLLETFQAGLSWECILNKREAFRRAFDGFDFERIARYDEARLQVLQADAGIVRNRMKIRAAVSNARVFMDIRHEAGSFDAYLWGMAGGRPLRETGRTTSPLSDRIAADLRRRGMRFTGSTVIYAYLQAVGVIFAHEEGCRLAR